MPSLNPNTPPLNIEDFLQLRETLEKSQGFDKVSLMLSFQRAFFGLFGTAIFMRQNNGTFVPIAFTNIPNSPDEEIDGQVEVEETDEDEEEEIEVDEEEMSEQDEFHQLTQALFEKLVPAFQHEKQPRFFENAHALTEFVSEELVQRFDGYKLMVIPMYNHTKGMVTSLIFAFTNEYSEYLVEEEAEKMEQLWKMWASSMKVI